MKTISLLDLINQVPYPAEEPFFLDVRLFDIPSVIVGTLNNLPSNCIGISLAYDIGAKGRAAAIDICRRNDVSAKVV